MFADRRNAINMALNEVAAQPGICRRAIVPELTRLPTFKSPQDWFLTVFPSPASKSSEFHRSDRDDGEAASSRWKYCLPMAAVAAAETTSSIRAAIERRSPTGSEAICLTVPCPSTRPVNMMNLQLQLQRILHCRPVRETTRRRPFQKTATIDRCVRSLSETAHNCTDAPKVSI
jgi:hypothetical protein